MRLLSLPFALLAAPLANAQATIHVPGDAATIQAGIDLAHDGDTVLVGPGTYLEAIQFRGKAITVASAAGAAATTIDAQRRDPTVRFSAGERDGSVLRGFTVTGGYWSPAGSGILCDDGRPTTPRIQGCVIRGNGVSDDHLGGGVSGNPTIEDCLLEDNVGGALHGAPTMRRCTVRANSGYDAAGLFLLGGLVEDTAIVENRTGESGDGAVLVAGPGVVLRRCVIARNHTETFGGYPVWGAGVRAWPAYVVTLESCTITANVIDTPEIYGDPEFGGLRGHANLVDTILRGNDAFEHDGAFPSGGLVADYSDIEGGWGGTGNFDLDPLFLDPAHGDYRPALGSPCIDTGSPLLPLDPDQSRADVGARAFTHGIAFERNGRGVNPPLLSSPVPPLLGHTWDAHVDASRVGGVNLAGVTFWTRAREPGVLLPQGELLVAGAHLAALVQASGGITNDFLFSIPNDVALIAYETHVQAYVAAFGQIHLGNALRLLFGQ